MVLIWRREVFGSCDGDFWLERRALSSGALSDFTVARFGVGDFEWCSLEEWV